VSLFKFLTVRVLVARPVGEGWLDAGAPLLLLDSTKAAGRQIHSEEISLSSSSRFDLHDHLDLHEICIRFQMIRCRP
jgi:hypothetical protein